MDLNDLVEKAIEDAVAEAIDTLVDKATIRVTPDSPNSISNWENSLEVKDGSSYIFIERDWDNRVTIFVSTKLFENTQ